MGTTPSAQKSGSTTAAAGQATTSGQGTGSPTSTTARASTSGQGTGSLTNSSDNYTASYHTASAPEEVRYDDACSWNLIDYNPAIFTDMIRRYAIENVEEEVQNESRYSGPSINSHFGVPEKLGFYRSGKISNGEFTEGPLYIAAREYPLPFITDFASSAITSQMVLTEFQQEDGQVATNTVTRDRRRRKSPDAETRSAAPLTGRQNSKKRDRQALDDEIVEAARQKIARQRCGLRK